MLTTVNSVCFVILIIAIIFVLRLGSGNGKKSLRYKNLKVNLSNFIACLSSLQNEEEIANHKLYFAEFIKKSDNINTLIFNSLTIINESALPIFYCFRKNRFKAFYVNIQFKQYSQEYCQIKKAHYKNAFAIIFSGVVIIILIQLCSLLLN